MGKQMSIKLILPVIDFKVFTHSVVHAQLCSYLTANLFYYKNAHEKGIKVKHFYFPTVTAKLKGLYADR